MYGHCHFFLSTTTQPRGTPSKSWVEAWRDISPVAGLPCSGVLALCLPSALTHDEARGRCTKRRIYSVVSLSDACPASYFALAFGSILSRPERESGNRGRLYG